MFSLITMMLRLVWLGLLVLGIGRAVELFRKGGEELVRRVEEGDSSGLADMCVRMHDALHRRVAGTPQSSSEPPDGPYGEV